MEMSHNPLGKSHVRCSNCKIVRLASVEDCPSGCNPKFSTPYDIRPGGEPDMTEDQINKAKASIEDWWLENSRQAIEAVAPKAAEYGSTDLAELGRDLAMLMNRDGMSHEELTELGIYMYMLGKFSRWRDAIKDGRRVSLDTIYDIKVYATMAERNRAVGGWPFPIDEEEK